MPTLTIDLAASLAIFDDKLMRTDDPRRRRTLELFRDRMVGELLGDPPRVFASLAPDFALVNRTPGAPDSVVDRDTFQTMFQQAVRMGVMVWGDWEHLIVDDDAVVIDGQLNAMLPAIAVGLSGEDPSALAIVRYPAVIIIDFENGLMRRELLFANRAAAQVTALNAEDAPDRTALAAELGVSSG